MDWEMKPNGTIKRWRDDSGQPILFAETELLFGEEFKLRGGAPVCVPNFGTVPQDGAYAGLTLPRHGLVRNCNVVENRPVIGNTAFYQLGPCSDEDGRKLTHFVFRQPFEFESTISAIVTSTPQNGIVLKHDIRFGSGVQSDKVLPYSLGFHPYFATHGQNFRVKHGSKSWLSEKHDWSKAVAIKANHDSVTLNTTVGTIVIELVAGYNSFYLWSDRPEEYVCIEPVLEGDKDTPLTLESGKRGEWIKCECCITYHPHPY